MNPHTKILISLIAATFLATSGVYAGSKPKGSKSPGAAAIKNEYIGKTWKWDGGGIYFAKDGTSMAVFKKSVGVGKWSVSSSGTICNNAVWHWDDKGHKNKKIKKCWKHTLAKDGELWAHDGDKNNWYEFSYNKISGGNRIKSKFSSLKKKIGF